MAQNEQFSMNVWWDHALCWREKLFLFWHAFQVISHSGNMSHTIVKWSTFCFCSLNKYYFFVYRKWMEFKFNYIIGIWVVRSKFIIQMNKQKWQMNYLFFSPSSTNSNVILVLGEEYWSEELKRNYVSFFIRIDVFNAIIMVELQFNLSYLLYGF